MKIHLNSPLSFITYIIIKRTKGANTVNINYIKIKDSIANGAEALARKSQEVIEISSLKMKISLCGSKINELYNELGEKYYKLYRHGKDENYNLNKICKKIEELNKDISDINKKIKDIN